MQGRHKAVCVVVLLLLPSLHAALIGQPASVDVAIATTAEPSPLAEQPSSGGEALVLVEQQSTTNTDSRPPVQTAQAVCSGTPPSSSYVTWTCFEGTADGAECAGSCVQGTKAPYGPPLAVCSGGAYTVVRTCMAGGTYNFDDVSIDGGLPGRFLGLNWSGLRVTRAATYTACDGVNGFKYGVLSAPNVAFSLEVGAAKGDLMNYVSVGAATPQQKISVLGFSATAAWQDNLRIEVAAWDANNKQVGVRAFQLSFFRPTLIDLRSDLRFSGINSLTIVSSGGIKVSCAAGQQVVLDNFEVYLHGDSAQ